MPVGLRPYKGRADPFAARAAAVSTNLVSLAGTALVRIFVILPKIVVWTAPQGRHSR